MMSTCARCGMEQGEWMDADKCSAHQDENDVGVIDCRNRELTNLHSLLRSVTGKLEEAHGCLFDIDDPAAAITARNLINQVLDVLL